MATQLKLLCGHSTIKLFKWIKSVRYFIEQSTVNSILTNNNHKEYPQVRRLMQYRKVFFLYYLFLTWDGLIFLIIHFHTFFCVYFSFWPALVWCAHPKDGKNNTFLHVGSDSLLLCSVIYKFVTTNTFNCHGTKAYIYFFKHKITKNGCTKPCFFCIWESNISSWPTPKP